MVNERPKRCVAVCGAIAGSASQSLWFDVNTIYHHVYHAEGYFEVSVNISNHLSWAVLTAPIVVATPVVNMMWLMPVPHASINVPFVAGVVMEMGTNVTLVWDFGDGSASAVVSKLRTGRLRYSSPHQQFIRMLCSVFLHCFLCRICCKFTQCFVYDDVYPVIYFCKLHSDAALSFICQPCIAKTV